MDSRNTVSLHSLKKTFAFGACDPSRYPIWWNNIDPNNMISHFDPSSFNWRPHHHRSKLDHLYIPTNYQTLSFSYLQYFKTVFYTVFTIIFN